MDTPEIGGAPASVVDVVVNPTVATSSSIDSGAEPQNITLDTEDDPHVDELSPSTNPASTDAEAATKAVEDAEKKARITQLRTEMSLVSSTTLNRKTQETVDHLATLDVVGKKTYLEENPHAKILTEIDFLRKLSAERIAEGSVVLDQSDPAYVFEGQTLGSITVVDGDNFTCTLSGSTETISITRDQLVAVAIGTNISDVLANFPDGSAQHRLIQTYFDTSAPGIALTEKQITDLPDLIIEVAESSGIVTTGTLIRAAEDHFQDRVPAAGASPEDIQRINEENEQSRQLLEQMRVQLKDRNLADANDIDQILSLRGLDKNGLAVKLARDRESVPLLQKAIEQTQGDTDKKILKKQLDTLQATIQVYEDIQRQITDTTTQEYLDKQQAGNVPAELGKSIAQAIERGDISALALMVSPEADIKATAEQKTKAREGREKFDSNVKTLGIAAALIALLLALGISQGAKQ